MCRSTRVSRGIKEALESLLGAPREGFAATEGRELSLCQGWGCKCMVGRWRNNSGVEGGKADNAETTLVPHPRAKHLTPLALLLSHHRRAVSPPAFPQDFQDQEDSLQEDEAEPPDSPVGPYAHWQLHQVTKHALVAAATPCLIPCRRKNPQVQRQASSLASHQAQPVSSLDP